LGRRKIQGVPCSRKSIPKRRCGSSVKAYFSGEKPTNPLAARCIDHADERSRIGRRESAPGDCRSTHSPEALCHFHSAGIAGVFDHEINQ
jgi:hypothetical protein